MAFSFHPGFSFIALLMLAACSVEPSGADFTGSVDFHGMSMGTSWTVRVATGISSRQEKWIVTAIIEEELDRVDRIFSTWRSDSEVSRFNRRADGGSYAVSDELAELFELARSIRDASGGAYDISVSPLYQLWGFGPGGDFEKADLSPALPVPDPSSIKSALELVGMDRLQLRRSGSQAFLQCRDGKTALDFSSVAKGYAVDRIAVAFKEYGLDDFLIEIGGEIRAVGNQPGREDGWLVGIQSPSGAPGDLVRTVVLRDEAVASSGTYYQKWTGEDGHEYSHIIDPRTGKPVDHATLAVSVLHEQASVADAWATALLCLGAEAGMGVAKQHGIKAIFIDRVDGISTSLP